MSRAPRMRSSMQKDLAADGNSMDAIGGPYCTRLRSLLCRVPHGGVPDCFDSREGH